MALYARTLRTVTVTAWGERRLIVEHVPTGMTAQVVVRRGTAEWGARPSWAALRKRCVAELGPMVAAYLGQVDVRAAVKGASDARRAGVLERGAGGGVSDRDDAGGDVDRAAAGARAAGDP